MQEIIAIMVAMDEEITEIKNIMENIEEKNIYGCIIYEGIINGLKSILVQTGVGKVNAARTTQIIIDKYKVKYIINVGTAGGLNQNLKIGDIVVGSKLVQHDFDITAFGHEKGYITNIGKIFNSNVDLIKKAQNVANQLKDRTNIIIGTIASGDIFCTNPNMKEKIKNKFNADCVEMEGASIAQVCTLDEVPFIVIRSISDIPDGNNAITFEEFIKFASKHCAEFIDIFLSDNSEK